MVESEHHWTLAHPAPQKLGSQAGVAPHPSNGACAHALIGMQQTINTMDLRKLGTESGISNLPREEPVRNLALLWVSSDSGARFRKKTAPPEKSRGGCLVV
jgi:hypothetical protein